MTVKICLWWHGYFELILLFCIIYSLRQKHTEWCNTYRKLVRCHQIDQTHANKNLRPIWCRSCTGSACREGGAAPNALVRRSASEQQKQSAEPEPEPFSVRHGARVEKHNKWALITIEPIRLLQQSQTCPYYNRAKLCRWDFEIWMIYWYYKLQQNKHIFHQKWNYSGVST
jgi:hypothetical protein